MSKRILVLGGAGFVGSNISNKFIRKGHYVTVIDALLPNTGGNKKNLIESDKLTFIQSRIENVSGLNRLVDNTDLIIDSMAWTLHLAAIRDPVFDLELNCRSHLSLITCLTKGKKVIYLGSRGQFGNPMTQKITEETIMIPEDVQGIHKMTAEFYYRIFSKIKGFDVISLRFPNCYGENQITEIEEIGLLASFFRDALLNKAIEVYGNNRVRSIIYVKDVVKAITLLSDYDFKGFESFNLNGCDVSIKDLAEIIVKLAGSGNVILKKMPEYINKIEVGNSNFSDEKFRKLFPTYKPAKLEDSIINTIKYFKEKLN